MSIPPPEKAKNSEKAKKTLHVPLTEEQQKALDDILLDAVQSRNLSRVSNCLEKGANPERMWRRLASRGAEYDKPLAIYAYDFFDKAILKLLVESGMSIDAVVKGESDDAGKTALMKAIIAKSPEKVEILLSLGANPLLADGDKVIALTLAQKSAAASDRDRERIIDLLLGALPSLKKPFNVASVSAGIEKPLPMLKSIVFDEGEPSGEPRPQKKGPTP